MKAGKLRGRREGAARRGRAQRQQRAAFNQLGIVYRKLGRFKEADDAYQRAVQIDPNYAIAYLNLGVLCDLYLQQPQRALEAYERYSRSPARRTRRSTAGSPSSRSGSAASRAARGRE